MTIIDQCERETTGKTADLRQGQRQHRHRRQPADPDADQGWREVPLMATLRTHNLTKSYSGRTVVKGVSLDVASSEIVGLLGPNGAGKTTTFYMTVGLTQPDSGRGRAGRARCDRRSDAHPCAQRHRLPAAGAVDLPRAHGGTEPAGNPGDHGSRRCQPPRAASRAARGAQPDAAGAGAGTHAVWRRAAARRDYARAGHLAEVHPAGRAVRRHRPDSGLRISRRSSFT